MPNMLRSIPSIGELLETPPLKSLVHRINRNVVVSGVRRFLDDMRTQVQAAAAGVHIPSAGELAERIADWIATEETPALRPVINASGIILHDELGRAPLAEEAIQAIAATARGYASLEVDLATGSRSQRTAAVERVLTRLTGAEAATVVNNNAAATLITLAALARGREVIVSRGQVLEIGDSYRLPDIIVASGAIVCEVGATNATRIGDYTAAIGPQTAALMRVHTSNYSVVGHAKDASLADLAGLARKQGLPLIDNIGSGSLIDLGTYGIRGGSLVVDSLRGGADLVLFSGDKLLGGPQCGIILGRRSLVQQIVQHPLMRAVRADKLTLAALGATLRLYADAELAERSVPVLTLLSTPIENLRHRAGRLAPQIAATGVATVDIVTGETSVAGHAIPNQTIPTICLVLTPLSGSAEALATALRSGTPSVIARLEEGRLLLDLRSVQPRDDAQLVMAIEAQRPATSHPSPEEEPVMAPT
jgi:L-seryl-tRNA(Ser) seleniumtransferase